MALNILPKITVERTTRGLRHGITLDVPRDSVSEGILHVFIGHWLQFREYFDFHSTLHDITKDLKTLGLDTSKVNGEAQQVPLILKKLDILYNEIEALKHEVLDSLREKEKNVASNSNHMSKTEMQIIYANKLFENKIFRASYEEKILKKFETEIGFKEKIHAMQNILINFLQLKVNMGQFVLYHPSYNSCHLSYYKMRKEDGVEEGATLVFCYKEMKKNRTQFYSLKTGYIVSQPATVIKTIRKTTDKVISMWFLKDDSNAGFLHTILYNWENFQAIDGNPLLYDDIMFLRNIYSGLKGYFPPGSNLVNIILFGKEVQATEKALTMVIQWYQDVRSKLWEAQNLLLKEVKEIIYKSQKIDIKTSNNQNNERTTKLEWNNKVLHLDLLKVAVPNTFLVKKINIGRTN